MALAPAAAEASPATPLLFLAHLACGGSARLEADRVITGYKAVVDPAALGREFEVIIHADLVAKDLATVAAFEERGTQRRHPDRRPGCLTMATYPP